MNQKNNNKPTVRNTETGDVEQLHSAEIMVKTSKSHKNGSALKAPKNRREGTVRSKKRKLFPIGTVLMLAVTTLLLMMMVSNYVVINEYTHEVSELRSDLQTLNKEKDKLSSELEQKNDYMTMERYASSVLGMESDETAEKVYIEVDEDDSIEVFEVEEDGTKGVIATVMSALSQNFIEAWNTLTDGE
ncbi:MAG: hypothetical protein IJX47_02670 [Clostridia bacterium]|nr:hypothetical protein [Clostridia bacterium]